MADPGRLHAIGEWWQGLSQAWRANVTLYALGVISLIALVVQVIAGEPDPPQRVEVASRAPSSVPTTLRTPVTAATTTAVPPPPPPGSDTTAAAPSSPQAPAPADSPTPLSVPPADDTAPATIPCRNTTDDRCGPFYLDPPPGQNQPLSVSVSTSGSNPTRFTVTVTDPDHPVSPTPSCTVVDFGDNSPAISPWGCSRPPCPDAHGPWDTPMKETGRQVFTFEYSYPSQGTYVATFSFDTNDICFNPYGGTGSGSATVVQPAP